MKTIKSILLTLLTIPVLFGHVKLYGQSGEIASVKKALDDFSRDPALRNATWGFYAVSTTDGREVASYNADRALIPASTQKVVTTLTALLMLGSDFRFETLLQYDGYITNGVLNGNLYIKGSGDPSLGAALLNDTLSIEYVYSQWLKDIKAAGIEKIQGHIIADGSLFDDFIVPPRWTWEDIGNYYGAGAHALTVNENLYSVYFEPGRQVGQRAKVIRTLPVVPGMTFKNDVKTGPRGSGDKVYIYGAPYSYNRWLTGTVPLGQSNFEVKGSLPDPGHFIAASFKEYLKVNQTAVTGEAFTHLTVEPQQATTARVTISRRLSPTLDIIAGRTNLFSVNTYAENLMKTLGVLHAGEGSFEAGTKVITEFWRVNGIDINGMRLHDGSGLSAYNNITPRQITLMLQYTSRNEALFQSFIPGLPVAGQSGSLASMFASTPSVGILRAKSGFLGNVRAYTGYTQSRDGKLIAFTLMVNNYSGTPASMRRKMEVLMDALTRATID